MLIKLLLIVLVLYPFGPRADDIGEQVKHVYFSGSRQLPSRVIGAHMHRYPEGSPLTPAPPTGAFSIVRSHDYGPPTGCCKWFQVDITGNPTNSYTAMDKWVNDNAAAGRKLYYTVYGAPTDQSSNPGSVGPYGYLGEGGPISSQTGLSDYVTAILQRYSGNILWIENWNEPGAFACCSSGAFYWGSMAQLAEQQKTIFNAARAVDATVKVVCPAFTNNPGHIRQYLLTAVPSDVGGSNALARDYCDAIAYHLYENEPLMYRAPTSENLNLEVEMATVKQAMADGGASSKPLYLTENGWHDIPEGAIFHDKPFHERACMLKDWVAISVGLGADIVIMYGWDGSHLGVPSPMDVPVMQQAHIELTSMFDGSTLLEVVRLQNNKLRVKTNNGYFSWGCI